MRRSVIEKYAQSDSGNFSKREACPTHKHSTEDTGKVFVYEIADEILDLIFSLLSKIYFT